MSRALFALLALVACGPHWTTTQPTDDAAPAIDAASDAPASCSVDLTADPKNCGYCSHDCLGGACTQGQCQPVTIATLQNGPLSIAARDGVVYWTTHDGTVLRAGSDANVETIARLAPFGLGVSPIAIDEDAVYWINGGLRALAIAAIPDGGLGDAASDAGAPALIGQAAMAPSLALDGAHAFVVDSSNYLGSLPKTPSDAGSPDGAPLAPTRLYTATQFQPLLAADAIDQNLFFTHGALESIPKDGLPDGGVAAIVASDPVSASSIALFGDWVYFSDSTRGLVGRVSRKGGAVERIAVGRDTPGPLAVDSTGVYWSDNGTNEILSCPLAGCPSSGPRLLATLGLVTSAIVVDDVAIYWTSSSGASPEGLMANVTRLAK